LIPAGLRLRRLFALWTPLALTFLLLSGGTPVVNASINRLVGRDHARELAGYALLLSFAVFLHSPLLVAREIGIKLTDGKHGMRRALLICTVAGVVVAALELLLGFTPLGGVILGAFTDDRALAEAAHRALPLLAPMPLFIAVRGVFQAQEIRSDNTILVGLGTLVRLGVTALLGLGFGDALGFTGASLGAFCMSVGIAVETGVGVLGGRRSARLRPPTTGEPHPRPVRFALLLMLANTLSVGSLIFHLRIAGRVPPEGQPASLAAFQEVRSLVFFLNAGAIALQSLTTAKALTPEGAARMMRFALLVGIGLSAVAAVGCFTPLRDVVLVTLLGERPGGEVMRLLLPALAIGVAMPFLQALRFALRGVLIARGATAAITLSTGVTLLLLASALAFALLPSLDNGAWNSMLWWTATLVLEIALLLRAALYPRRPPLAELPAPLRSPRESTAG